MGKNDEGTVDNEVDPNQVELVRGAREAWAEFKETGQPIEEMSANRLSGYKVDDSGDLVVDTNMGIRRSDGTVVTDTSSSRAAIESAYTLSPDQIDPNRIDQIADVQLDGAKAGAESGQETALEQLRRADIGVLNAASLGSGRQLEALATEDYLADQSRESAMVSADETRQRRQATSQLVGGVGGIAASFALGREDKTKANKKAQLHSGPF